MPHDLSRRDESPEALLVGEGVARPHAPPEETKEKKGVWHWYGWARQSQVSQDSQSTKQPSRGEIYWPITPRQEKAVDEGRGEDGTLPPFFSVGGKTFFIGAPLRSYPLPSYGIRGFLPRLGLLWATSFPPLFARGNITSSQLGRSLD